MTSQGEAAYTFHWSISNFTCMKMCLWRSLCFPHCLLLLFWSFYRFPSGESSTLSCLTYILLHIPVKMFQQDINLIRTYSHSASMKIHGGNFNSQTSKMLCIFKYCIGIAVGKKKKNVCKNLSNYLSPVQGYLVSLPLTVGTPTLGSSGNSTCNAHSPVPKLKSHLLRYFCKPHPSFLFLHANYQYKCIENNMHVQQLIPLLVRLNQCLLSAWPLRE